MTDQEKEEDYELHLHISTFMSEDIPIEDTSKLQLMTIPQPLQIESASTKHQVAIPTKQSIILTHQQEGGEEIEEDIKSDNPKYVMTKENLKKIAAARKKKTNQEKRKGKRKLILSESEDEKDILATIVDIIEETAANKISVETQFKRFVDAKAKQGRPKKVKTTTLLVDENIVDLECML